MFFPICHFSKISKSYNSQETAWRKSALFSHSLFYLTFSLSLLSIGTQISALVSLNLLTELTAIGNEIEFVSKEISKCTSLEKVFLLSLFSDFFLFLFSHSLFPFVYHLIYFHFSLMCCSVKSLQQPLVFSWLVGFDQNGRADSLRSLSLFVFSLLYTLSHSCSLFFTLSVSHSLSQEILSRLSQKESKTWSFSPLWISPGFLLSLLIPFKFLCSHTHVCQSCQLAEVSGDIGNCTKLIEISLSVNQLTSLPGTYIFIHFFLFFCLVLIPSL